MNFDTRDKIVNLDQAGALARELKRDGTPLVAFISHLEVLRASHVRTLQNLAAEKPGKLFVILTEPESPLVPLQARAEVAAGLRVVDYVVPSPGGAGPALAALDAGLTVHDEEEDRVRTRELIEHVRSRARI
jgi:hypothetical protein